MNEPLSTKVTAQEAAESLERARLAAAVNLELVSEQLITRALNPANKASDKFLLDVADFNYRLSGLANKQAPASGQLGFKVAFNFNAAPNGKPTGVTIEASPIPEPDELGAPPSHVALFQVANDLMAEPA